MDKNALSNNRRLDAPDLRWRIQVVSHDVRSMLGPIRGFAELIAESDDLELNRRHAARIVEASARLEDLADGLVDRILAVDTPGEPADTD